MTEIENDNIIKTMKLHIKVAKDDVQKLIDVTTVYAEACTYISEYIFNNGFELGFMNLQEKIYHTVRNKFKLKSQMTISAIKTSAARYKSVKEQLFQKPYKYKKAMLAVAVTVVVLFVAMTVQRHGIKTQLEVYGQRYENAEQNLDAEKDRTGKIDDEAEYIKTDEYVEGVARDRLGLVHETETVFVKK